MKKNSSPATNSRSVVKPKPHAEAIDRDVETLPPFRGATQTELRDHMDSNKPVLFIPTEALGVVSDALKKWERAAQQGGAAVRPLGVVSDALKKWEAQQMGAKQPSTLRDSCVSGQVAGPLRATPACFATSPGLVLASGQVAGPLRATPPRALLPSMIDRAHDRVSTLRDKLQGLHERLGPVLRPSTPQPVNGCSAVEDVSVMPDAVQSVYALGARLNELIEHVNDLLDRVET